MGTTDERAVHACESVALRFMVVHGVSHCVRGCLENERTTNRYLACRHRLGELNRSSTTSSRSPSWTPKYGFGISRSVRHIVVFFFETSCAFFF